MVPCDYQTTLGSELHRPKNSRALLLLRFGLKEPAQSRVAQLKQIVSWISVDFYGFHPFWGTLRKPKSKWTQPVPSGVISFKIWLAHKHTPVCANCFGDNLCAAKSRGTTIYICMYIYMHIYIDRYARTPTVEHLL